MRTKFLFFLAFLFTLQVQAQTAPKDLGDFIYTVPLVKRIALSRLQVNWWNEYLEWPQQDNFFKRLIERIDSGKIQVMTPEYPFTQVASASDVKQMLHHADTAMVQNIETGDLDYVVSISNFNRDEIISITFYENWSFEESTMTFLKKVKGFTINKERIDQNTGESRGEMPLFYIPTDKIYNLNTGSEKDPADMRTIPFITYTFDPNNYFLDDNAVMNQSSQEQFLIGKINAAAGANTTVLHTPNFPYTGIPDKKTIPVLLDKMKSVKNIKFYEEWNMDVNRLVFEKKVKAIILRESPSKSDTIQKEDRDMVCIALNGFVPNDPYKLSQITIPKQAQDIIFGNLKEVIPNFMDSRVINGDSAKLMAMAVTMSEKVKTHKVQCYPDQKGFWDDPWDPMIHIPKPDADVNAIFSWNDSVQIQNPETGEFEIRVLPHDLSYSGISGFRFFESWKLDLTTLHFEKSVRSIAPKFLKQDGGETYGMLFRYSVDVPPTDPKTIVQPQYLLAQNISYTVPIDYDVANANADYFVGNENGIIWEESWMENLYQFQYYPLVNGILEGVMNGKIKAWHYAVDKKMSKKDVKLKLESMKDSTFIKGKDLSTDYTLVNRILFNEDWYFDPSTLQFYKKVNSITLIHAVRGYDERQEVTWKENVLFTIKLN